MSRTNMEVRIERLIGKPGVMHIHVGHTPVERIVYDENGVPIVKVTAQKVKRPPPPKLTGAGVSG